MAGIFTKGRKRRQCYTVGSSMILCATVVEAQIAAEKEESPVKEGIRLEPSTA